MPNPVPHVAIVGQGVLADAIRAAVMSMETQARQAEILVTSRDSWDQHGYDHMQKSCDAQGTQWLPVHTEVGKVVIGPWYTPGVAGCVVCVEFRRSLADDLHDVRKAVRDKYPRLTDTASSWLTSLTARTVAALVREEILGAPTQSGRTRGALLCVDLSTLAVTTHRFLPDPLCPACGGLPDDSPEAARIVVQARPKPTPVTYRVRPLDDADLDLLRSTYVDDLTGLVRRIETFPSGAIAVGAASMRTRWQSRAELSWGRTNRYRRSQMVALLEALERHGGMAPGGRRTVVQASFTQVEARAVDPRTLGLYPPAHYSRPGFSFQPFDVDRVCRWVWGYSFARDEPILVPQTYAYYRAHAADASDPSFAYEISNGCALGSCIEEAVLYGLLEVVERDAFLMTWYARLSAPRLEVGSARDRTIPILAHAIEAQTGYRVHLFDITMEHGIPSVWAMAVSPTGIDQPALVCAAGSHLDPEQAAAGALYELGPILADLMARYPDVAEHARAMTIDPTAVASMDDHSVLYTDREAAGRLDFLLAGTPSKSFGDMESRYGIDVSFRHTDLTDDLLEAVKRLRHNGLDTIVVDQTTPEHRAGGFRCVKVIVPGALPMTFGHENRRTYGLPRLLDVPVVLGYRDRPLEPGSINPHPHPFP